MSTHPLTPDQIRAVVGTDEDRERWSAQDSFLERETARQDAFTADVLAYVEAGRERFVREYSTDAMLAKAEERELTAVRAKHASRRSRR